MSRFTVANARLMAAKSHAARQQRIASARLAAETIPQTPQLGSPEAVTDYVSRRLARVRAQLDLVDKAFEVEATKANPDGQRLNWLAQAQERLSEQERLLSGRPLPGSRRPPSKDSGRPTPHIPRMLDDLAPEPASVVLDSQAVEPLPG